MGAGSKPAISRRNLRSKKPKNIAHSQLLLYSKYKGLGPKKKSIYQFHNSEKDNLLDIEIPNEMKILYNAWPFFFLNQTIE